MTKPAGPQASDTNQLSIDELDAIVGGHGVAIPPTGFENLEQSGGSTSAGKANWGSTAQNINRNNSGISKGS